MIKACEEAIEHNYLVSLQLWVIHQFIENDEYSFSDEVI